MMAKKKKSQRRRNFAYSSSGKRPSNQASPKPVDETLEISEITDATPVAEAKASVAKVDSHDQSYLRQDLRMIGILAVSAVALELLLWILLRHTGLGHSLFNL